MQYHLKQSDNPKLLSPMPGILGGTHSLRFGIICHCSNQWSWTCPFTHSKRSSRSVKEGKVNSLDWSALWIPKSLWISFPKRGGDKSFTICLRRPAHKGKPNQKVFTYSYLRSAYNRLFHQMWFHSATRLQIQTPQANDKAHTMAKFQFPGRGEGKNTITEETCLFFQRQTSHSFLKINVLWTQTDFV